MRSNSELFGLIKPLDNELFSAWLLRGEASANPLPFARAREQLLKYNLSENNVPIPPRILSQIATTLNVSPTLLNHAFSPTGNWLVIPGIEREFMCEHCLIEDFKCHRQPTTRRLWGHLWFNVCLEHGGILKRLNSTEPAIALFNALDAIWGPEIVWRRHESYAVWQMRKVGPPSYKMLILMASAFQQWYLTAVHKNRFVIAGQVIDARQDQFELFMDDVLAIIGKKRRHPYDARSYIARLLDIKGWSTLSSDLSPSAGCERLLCFSPGEHTPPVRMAMFALLGLFIKIPGCMRIYLTSTRSRPYSDGVERLWWGMHSEVGFNQGYLAWLRDRSQAWAPSIKKSFNYLLVG
ncbi:hypothetical protein LZ023_23205 [Pseudomonas silvicola]|nr:hypothetical protein LZ023_23205 [Pseudomonas silvicola]